MPMLDAYIPEGALSPQAEDKLLARLTDLLLQHEGVDPANQAARALAWVFVHRPAVYVGGSPAAEPRYRFVCQVPEGQYNDKRRQAVTAAMTQAVADAEGGSHPDPSNRVWVFTIEIPDGTWGGFGRVIRLPDIAEHVLGPDMRAPAQQWLAARQRKTAAALIEMAGADIPGLPEPHAGDIFVVPQGTEHKPSSPGDAILEVKKVPAAGSGEVQGGVQERTDLDGFQDQPH